MFLRYNFNYSIKHLKVCFDFSTSSNNMSTAQRKSDHIRIVLEENVKSGLTNGFEKYQFEHNALPELDLNQVDLTTTFLNHRLKVPLLISSMTGGNEEAGLINRTLAIVAQQAGMAMGVGSQRAGLERPNSMESFKVRQFAPDILLFANVGAVQLNYGYSISDCQRAVDAIQADALFLHLNPLQEALQPEGNVDFLGLLKKIELVCKGLSVPVLAKEVGWGISAEVARRLAEAGVSAIDVAGAGGTSWSQVEKFRIKDEMRRNVAQDFVDWGLSTADCLVAVRQAVPDLPLIASGGLASGIDAAKGIALGASLAGMAGKFLKAAAESENRLMALVDEISFQIRVCMFSAGVKDINTLKKVHLIKK